MDRLDALYFSMTTMSTVGYGDIHAQGQLARLLVTVQLVFNLVFVASLVSLIQDQIRQRGAREWLRSTSTDSTPEPPVDDDGPRCPRTCRSAPGVRRWGRDTRGLCRR